MHNLEIMAGVVSRMYGLDMSFADDEKTLSSLLCEVFERFDERTVQFCDNLSKKIATLDESSIYEYKGNIGLTILILKWCKRYMVVSPFISKECDEEDFDRAFPSDKVPGDIRQLYKMKYYAYPRRDKGDVISLIKSIMETLTPFQKMQEFLYKGVENVKSVDELDVNNFAPIDHRYIAERKFITAIEAGDVQGAFNALNMMDVSSKTLNVPFIREKSVAVGFAILRTICKIAAYNVGVAPVVIEEISAKHSMIQESLSKYESHASLTGKVGDMINDYCDAVNKTKNHNYSPIIKYVVSYIELNYAKSVTLEDISKNCGISKNYLPHAFKNETGKTVMEYLSDYRLDRAANLLKQTSMPIQDVGNETGYPDNNYFTKSFKKRFGMTPSAYRKSNK